MLLMIIAGAIVLCALVLMYIGGVVSDLRDTYFSVLAKERRPLD
jgi:hypothetical protein